jgi:hypothetical protein
MVIVTYLEADDEVLEREEVVPPSRHGCGAEDVAHTGQHLAGRPHHRVMQLHAQAGVLVPQHARLGEVGGKDE